MGSRWVGDSHSVLRRLHIEGCPSDVGRGDGAQPGCIRTWTSDSEENERTQQPEGVRGGGGIACDSWFLSMPVKPQCYFPTSLTVKFTVCHNICCFLSLEETKGGEWRRAVLRCPSGPGVAKEITPEDPTPLSTARSHKLPPLLFPLPRPTLAP